MSADLSSRGAKGLLRERAYESLDKYGPGVVCIFMNTEDREEWEMEFGERLDPGVEGVPFVDDPRHPSSRLNVVYQEDFNLWKQGKPIKGRGDVAKKGPDGPRRRRRPTDPQPESIEEQAKTG